MRIYKTKSHKIAGSDFREVHHKAWSFFINIKKKSKRRSYIRSAFFNKEKIFLDLFWQHLFDKLNWRDRVRRLRYYSCALELIRYSRYNPSITKNPNVSAEVFYRFYGASSDNELFCVQIKERVSIKQKYLLSVFPVDDSL